MPRQNVKLSIYWDGYRSAKIQALTAGIQHAGAELGENSEHWDRQYSAGFEAGLKAMKNSLEKNKSRRDDLLERS